MKKTILYTNNSLLIAGILFFSLAPILFAQEAPVAHSVNDDQQEDIATFNETRDKANSFFQKTFSFFEGLRLTQRAFVEEKLSTTLAEIESRQDNLSIANQQNADAVAEGESKSLVSGAGDRLQVGDPVGSLELGIKKSFWQSLFFVFDTLFVFYGILIVLILIILKTILSFFSY